MAAITDALLRIVAERGLDQASVREVASAAEVSIGTVQHYFPTKDVMLAAAFTEVVRRIRARVGAVELGPDVRRNMSTVLRELLPLDDERADEVRVQMAFAARAATAPDLADIQRTVLDGVHRELLQVFARAAGGGAPQARFTADAHLALAAVDGLALHAVSSREWLTPAQQSAALERLIDVLMAG